MIRSILERAVRRGEIRDDVDLEAVGGYVVGQRVREVCYGVEQSCRHGWVGCENRAERVETVRTRAEIRVDFRFGQVT